VRRKNALLVVGVQGKNTAEMLEYARRAQELAPDALIAMPPSTGKSQEDYREYFRALAKLTQRPVIIQTSGGARDLAPSVDLIVDLAMEFPHLGHIKEESSPLWNACSPRFGGGRPFAACLVRVLRKGGFTRCAWAWTASLLATKSILSVVPAG
jgi:hypothetical protein